MARESSPDAFDGFGGLYAGDLLRDIVKYRTLRHAALDSGATTATGLELERLEARLRRPHVSLVGRPESRRAFRRFACDFGARLLFAQGGVTLERTGHLMEISAGGARWTSHAIPLGRGDIASLVIGGDEGKTFVFPSRVVWTTGPQMGLRFDGTPRETSFDIPPLR